MNARIGPNTKPTPNAAPIKPSPWVRVFSVVLSAMAAWAVAMFAPERPSMTRERNNSQSVSAKPSRMKPANVPIWLTTKTGLRPKRSDSRPRIGAPMNCIMG